jgi:hypothetical protein
MRLPWPLVGYQRRKIWPVVNVIIVVALIYIKLHSNVKLRLNITSLFHGI